jgi:hypothetical protein
MGLPIPSARELMDGSTSAEEQATRRSANTAVKSAREVSTEYSEFVAEMTKATIAGLNGVTEWDASPDAARGYVGNAQVAPIRHNASRHAIVTKAIDDYEMAKSTEGAAPAWDRMSKEWTLANPVSTGLVPYDLEAPAKLLTPRPTPLRNSIPRVKGQGAARRFKAISGFTGTGTGGQTTTQPGIGESTTNSGPGGLSYIRGPYISYAGYDVTLNYVTTSLSDSVSWQAEYQGQGFEDIRSLSNTALLYSTMLLDERLMIYGRGSQTGYAGALGTPASVTLTAVTASVAPAGSTSPALAATSWVVVAADAGDLLGTNGTTMHQGPATAAASVAVTTGQAIQVTVGTDVVGALGYNLFVGSVSSGPFVYAGRTGYNVGYIKSQPASGPEVASGAADQSAVTNNYDGLLTNTAASGGYVTRLNGALSTTNPGTEFQTGFASLYEAVKGDPEELWLNGFDRLQLSNAVLNNAANSAYQVFIQNDSMSGINVGAVVSTMLNEVTGSSIPITVHPWFPQGNALIRQKTLPIPDSNVSETSVMTLPQDYVAVQWPVTQFTYDASTFEIGTFCHYAPAWNGLIQGIQGVGIGTTPPSFGDS